MKNKALSLFFALIIPQLAFAQHGSGGAGALGGLVVMLSIIAAVSIGLLVIYPLITTYRASKDKASYSSIVLCIWISYLSLAISIMLLFMGGVPAILSLGVSLYCIRKLHDKKKNFAPKTDSMLLDDI
jgi:hypothetical protein